MTLLSRAALAHAITLGRGRTRPQGRRVELDAADPIAALARVLAEHVGPGAWWCASTFEDDYRHGERWESAAAMVLDLDFYDRAGAHAAIPADVAATARAALGDLPNLVHDTPRGLRGVIVLAEPVTDRELFSRCAQGLTTEATKRLGDLLRAERPGKPGAAGLAIDPTVSKDCARFLWGPSTTVDGVARAATVSDTRTEPWAADDLAALAPEPAATPAREPAAPAARGDGAWADVRAELLRRLSVRSVLAQHGVTVGDNGAAFSCPLHGPDRSPSAWIHRGDDGLDRLYCAHGRHGLGVGVETQGGKLQLDALDLVAHFRGLPLGKATAALARELGIPTPGRPAKAQAAAQAENLADDDAFVAELLAGGDPLATLAPATVARLAAMEGDARARALAAFRAAWPKAGCWRDLAGLLKRHGRAARDTDDGRPAICVNNPRLDLAVNEIEAALVAMNAPVYVRSGGLGLTRIVRACATDRGPVRRENGAPVMEPAPLAWLRDLVAAGARCYASSKDGERPARPAMDLFETLAARGHWPELRHLAGIASGPVLRPDGTLAARPGWDEFTGLLLDFDPSNWPAIPERPTLDDARRAYAELLAPFADFPFVAPCDRAAFAGLALSVLARDAFDGPAPAYAITAPSAGTGKSLLSSCAGIIATGRHPAMRTWSGCPEETAKVLLTVALAGDPLIVFDNVAAVLESNELAAVLTAQTMSGRVLGQSREASAPWRAVVTATGNNLSIRGDLQRRVVPVRLDSRLEAPEDRAGFAIPDLLGHVRERRPRLAAAGLTLLRAHAVAGYPQPAGMSAYGSFDGWNRTIRAAILWATGHDARERAAELRADDPERESWAALLLAWRGAIGDTPRTAADALARSELDDDAGKLLREALAELCPREPTPKALGYVLRRMAGRPIGGLRLEQERMSGRARWRVLAD